MTKKEASEIWPVLKAYAEGQDVEIFCKVADKPQSYWHIISEVKVNEGYDFPYRVKPLKSNVANNVEKPKMIFPEFPESFIPYGVEQNTEKMISWVEEMISIAIQNPDIKSVIARNIFDEVHYAGHIEGSVTEQW